MKKKTKELNDNLKQNHEALEEILGDIKDVVSGETETRFKVQMEQKVIKLKKSDLVNCNSVNQTESGSLLVNKTELEALVRKIVRQEFRKKDENLGDKKKEGNGQGSFSEGKIQPLSKMNKSQLEEIGRKSGIDLDKHRTKASLLKELEAKGTK